MEEQSKHQQQQQNGTGHGAGKLIVHRAACPHCSQQMEFSVARGSRVVSLTCISCKAVTLFELHAAQPTIRSRQRDKLFKTQAWKAFETLKYTKDTALPKTGVLARDPYQASTYDLCPKPLWELIQNHGGYSESDRNKVSRGRIKRQLDLWKRKTFGAAVTGITNGRPTTLKGLELVLQTLVPDTQTLLRDIESEFNKVSSLYYYRPQLTAIVLWSSDNSDCLRFWSAQRELLISTFAEVSHSHPNDCAALDDALRKKESDRTRSAVTMLQQVNDWRTDQCDFCTQQFQRCNCLGICAWEAILFFSEKFTNIVVGNEPDALQTPPTNATLPASSQDVVYHIAGFAMNKLKKKAMKTTRVTPQARYLYGVFSKVHSINQSQAHADGLPTGKVTVEQWKEDSLTYASEYMYDFFYQLELVFWLNLSLHNVSTRGPAFMGMLQDFAGVDVEVLRAWNICVDHVVEHVQGGGGGERGGEDSSRIQTRGDRELRISSPMGETAAMKNSAIVVFDLLVSTYTNVRGKEFVKTHVPRQEAAARTSGHRDKMAMTVVAPRREREP